MGSPEAGTVAESSAQWHGANEGLVAVTDIGGPEAYQEGVRENAARIADAQFAAIVAEMGHQTDIIYPYISPHMLLDSFRKGLRLGLQAGAEAAILEQHEHEEGES